MLLLQVLKTKLEQPQEFPPLDRLQSSIVRSNKERAVGLEKPMLCRLLTQRSHQHQLNGANVQLPLPLPLLQHRDPLNLPTPLPQHRDQLNQVESWKLESSNLQPSDQETPIVR